MTPMAPTGLHDCDIIILANSGVPDCCLWIQAHEWNQSLYGLGLRPLHIRRLVPFSTATNARRDKDESHNYCGPNAHSYSTKMVIR